MLIEFKVSNFKSFLEEQTLSLVASNYEKELSEHLIAPELPGMKKVKLLRGAAIYGANASGKSNLIEAIEFLRNCVLHHNPFPSRLIAKEPLISVQPFKLIPDELRPDNTDFYVAFTLNDFRFEFFLSLSAQRILHESVVAYPNGRKQVLYDRRYDQSKNRYVWSHHPKFASMNAPLEGRTRPDAVFLRVASEFNHEVLSPVFFWFLSINVRGAADSRSNLMGLLGLDSEATEACVRDDGHRRRVLELLRSADLGVTDMTVEKAPFPLIAAPRQESATATIESPTAAREHLEVCLTHQGLEDFKSPLDWHAEESLGTKQLFSLLGPWLDTLDRGGVILVDEIESSLHPILVRELLRMFLHRASDAPAAQIVFTTHNPLLLDHTLLRRDQVWFTEKDSRGMTHLYPLSDYSPRRDESLPRGYMAGRYGAIPSIPEGFGQ